VQSITIFVNIIIKSCLVHVIWLLAGHQETLMFYALG
jgi:hypothetical protein